MGFYLEINKRKTYLANKSNKKMNEWIDISLSKGSTQDLMTVFLIQTTP